MVTSERTLGGLEIFLPYIKDYVKTFMRKSITTEQWVSHLYSYFEKHGGAEKIELLNKVNWDVSTFSMTSIIAIYFY